MKFINTLTFCLLIACTACADNTTIYQTARDGINLFNETPIRNINHFEMKKDKNKKPVIHILFWSGGNPEIAKTLAAMVCIKQGSILVDGPTYSSGTVLIDHMISIGCNVARTPKARLYYHAAQYTGENPTLVPPDYDDWTPIAQEWARNNKAFETLEFTEMDDETKNRYIPKMLKNLSEYLNNN